MESKSKYTNLTEMQNIFQIIFRSTRHGTLSCRAELVDHSLAAVDGFIYVCGGSVEGGVMLEYQEHVSRLDTSLNQWEEVVALQEGRARLAAVGHEGLLYAVGTHEVRAVQFALSGFFFPFNGLMPIQESQLFAFLFSFVLYSFIHSFLPSLLPFFLPSFLTLPHPFRNSDLYYYNHYIAR